MSAMSDSTTDHPTKSRVLIIDDEQGLRSTLCDMLEDEGYDVQSAADGDKGLDLLAEHDVDLVVTDILMPHKEGIETIAELRQKFPNVKIIAMSGGGRTRNLGFLEVAKKMGANAALAKPFTMDQFLKVVRETLGQDL